MTLMRAVGVCGLWEADVSLRCGLELAIDRILAGWESMALCCVKGRRIYWMRTSSCGGDAADGSFASKDLYTAISNGDFPEWYMYIQASAPVLHVQMQQCPAMSDLLL